MSPPLQRNQVTDYAMAEIRVTTEQLTYPGDGLYYFHGQPLTGVLEIRCPDGNLESEQDFKDGLVSGRKRIWHPSGGLQLDAECGWGGYHGRVRQGQEAGQLAEDSQYEYGIRSHGTQWDEQGHVIEQFELTAGDPLYDTLIAQRAAFEGDERAT